jgi:hypothetical protein
MLLKVLHNRLLQLSPQHRQADLPLQLILLPGKMM